MESFGIWLSSLDWAPSFLLVPPKLKSVKAVLNKKTRISSMLGHSSRSDSRKRRPTMEVHGGMVYMVYMVYMVCATVEQLRWIQLDNHKKRFVYLQKDIKRNVWAIVESSRSVRL